MRLAFAISALICTSALACPELSGTYKCDAKKQALAISQSVAKGITTYVIHGDTRIADNEVHELPDSSMLINQQYRAFCHDDVLSIQNTGKSRDGYGKLDMQIDMFFLNDKFIYSITGFYNPKDNGKPVPVDEYITCELQ